MIILTYFLNFVILMALFRYDYLEKPQYILSLVLLTSFFLVFYFAKPKNIPNIRVVPPNSILGYSETFICGNRVHETFLSNETLYGSVYQYSFLFRQVVTITDMTIAKEVLRNIANKGFFNRPNPHTMNKNILNMDTGKEWNTRRKTFSRAFTQSALKHRCQDIEALVTKLISNLRACANTGDVVPIDRLFGQLAIDVIAKIGFSYEIDALNNSDLFSGLHDDFETVFETAWTNLIPCSTLLSYMPWTVFSRLRKARNRLNSFWETLFDHIQTLASGGELHPDSIAAMIIRFSLMEGVTKKDVIGEISILFIAGHETTAHTLSWYIYSLCLHPGIQIANQAAIDVEYDWGSDAESESLTLPALVEATMKESMRRYPVVPQGSIRRVVDKDGYTVKSPGVHIHLPQGTYVQIPIYAVHNSQKNWGPTALTFNPFRWLADLDDEVDKDVFDDDEVKDGDNIFDKRKIMSGSFVGCGPTTDTLAYCPFSFGPRNCLGMNLALLELRKTIPRLLREFNFSFADPRMLDECFAMQTFITLRPTNELLVRLSVRKHCDSGDFITATLSKDSSAGSHTCTPVSTATNSNGLGAFIFREPTKSDKKYL